MTLPVIFPGSVVAGGKPSIVCTDNDGDNTSATTHTFTSKSIGTAASRRAVIVFLYAGAVTSSLTMTIDGNAMTELTGCAIDVGVGQRGRAFALNVPTGTTATIVVTLGAAGSAYIGVFAAYNLRSTTPTDTATDSGANPLNLEVDVQSRGVAAGYAWINGVQSWTWAGLSEDFDANVSGNIHSGASYTAVAEQTPLTITANRSGAGSPLGMAASFR